MTAKEYVDIINKEKVSSPLYIDDFIDLGEVTEVATIDRDEHRWYTLATVVYQTADKEYFGVFGPISLKSEEMSFSDIKFECEAFEMEQIPSVTYRVKK